jgi:hypothetical protein
VRTNGYIPCRGKSSQWPSSSAKLKDKKNQMSSPPVSHHSCHRANSTNFTFHAFTLEAAYMRCTSYIILSEDT